ncbi:MAG: hypothetical protein N2444_06605 [Methylocystis sp.]|nr:hypothetical protein [Methylocystis sp.]
MTDELQDWIENDPDIKLGGLSFRARPGSANDAWLNIVARVEAPGALVELRGPWVMDWGLRRFAEQLEVLDRELKGEASVRIAASQCSGWNYASRQ